jgi:23S rRNA pseudouridine2457 synthase
LPHKTWTFTVESGRRYIAFNKPYAVLSQFSQPAGSSKRTLAEFSFPKDVYPLGRLDYDSEGLILLSDDARLNNELLDPKNAHGRSYFAQVENIPDEGALARLTGGLFIDRRKTGYATAKLLAGEPPLPPRDVPIRFRKNIPTAWIQLTLFEGRNRQVRKMTAAVGFPTLRLIRVAIGSLKLLDLNIASGQWKDLSADEVLAALGAPK